MRTFSDFPHRRCFTLLVVLQVTLKRLATQHLNEELKFTIHISSNMQSMWEIGEFFSSFPFSMASQQQHHRTMENVHICLWNYWFFFYCTFDGSKEAEWKRCPCGRHKETMKNEERWLVVFLAFHYSMKLFCILRGMPVKDSIANIRPRRLHPLSYQQSALLLCLKSDIVDE